MHRTFWGAKRSTGARLEQKLVQLTSPGHAPTASLGCSFFLLPSPTPAISHPEREPDFSFTTKGSRSPRRWEENQRLDADDRRVSAIYVLSGHDRTRDGLGPNQRRPWHVVCLYRHVPLWQRWATSFLSVLGAMLIADLCLEMKLFLDSYLKLVLKNQNFFAALLAWLFW